MLNAEIHFRLPRSMYVKRIETVKQSRYKSACRCRGWRLKQSGARCGLGCHGYYVFNLVVWLCISGGQTRHCQIFTFRFDLEGQEQSTPRLILSLTKVFWSFYPNLVVLASTGGACFARTSLGLTHTRTRKHGQTQATTILENQKLRRVKSQNFGQLELHTYYVIDNFRRIILTAVHLWYRNCGQLHHAADHAWQQCQI